MLPTPPSHELEQTLIVLPWHDPVVEAVGFDARSSYVELFWLGILGPTATWLLRRLVTGLDAYPDGYELDLGETANAMGLSLTAGTHSPFGRALNRCVMFGMMQQVPSGMAVRRQLPPVPARHLNKLPAHLQVAHVAWVDRTRPVGIDGADRHWERALALAETMTRTGDEQHQIERQLLSLGVAPRMAVEAARHCASPA